MIDPTIEAYEKIARDFHARNKDTQYVDEIEFFRDIAPEHTPSLLEIGCGTGRDAAELIKQGFRYVGIDPSPAMLAIAQERLPDADFQEGDMYALDFDDESFDAIWAAAVLLHAPKARVGNVLASINRVLKPQGVGFFSVKEKRHMEEGFIDEEKAGGISRYFSFFEEDEFRNMLDEAGFAVLETRRITDPDGVTIWLCFFVQKD